MKKIFPFVILALLPAGGGWYWWHKSPAGSQNAAGSATGRPPQAVAVLEVKPQTITFAQQLPGRVSPYRQSQVRPQVDGIITARLFEEGAELSASRNMTM